MELLLWGENLFIPTPGNTLLGVGVYKRGGIKFLLHGASKYTPPPPSPGKSLLARNGGGGATYIISSWIFCLQLTILAFLLLTAGAVCLQWESASNKRLKGL